MSENKYVLTDEQIVKAWEHARQQVTRDGFDHVTAEGMRLDRAFAEEILRLAHLPRTLRRVEVSIDGCSSVEAMPGRGSMFLAEHAQYVVKQQYPLRMVAERIAMAVCDHNYRDAAALVEFLRKCHEQGPWEDE